MKKNIAMIILGALMLVACNEPVTQAELSNARSSFENPLYAGALPDGREVYMVEVKLQDKDPMFIFFSKDGKDMNTVQEYTERHGKQTHTYNKTQYYSGTGQ